MSLKRWPAPVVAYFNAAGDENFDRVVSALVSGVGGGVEEAFCDFQDGADGPATFWLFEESAVLSRPDLLAVIEEAVRLRKSA